MDNIRFDFLSDEVISKLDEAIKYLYFFPDFKKILNGVYPIYYTKKNGEQKTGTYNEPLYIKKFKKLPSEKTLIKFIDAFISVFKKYESEVIKKFEELRDININDFDFDNIDNFFNNLENDNLKKNIDYEDYIKVKLENFLNKCEYLEYKLIEIKNLIDKNKYKSRPKITKVFGNFASILIYLNKNYYTKFNLKFKKYLDTDIYEKVKSAFQTFNEKKNINFNQFNKKLNNPLFYKYCEYRKDKWKTDVIKSYTVGIVIYYLKKINIINPNISNTDLGYIGGILFNKDCDNIRKYINDKQVKEFFKDEKKKTELIEAIEDYTNQIILKIERS